MMMCINGTTAGIEPSCTVQGILPKGLMVLLIVGGILFLFLVCIPVDFYRYRKRKRVFRERRQRMEMMTRIEPLHANIYHSIAVSNSEATREHAKFSFHSILSFFRLVKNTRKRQENKRVSGLKDNPCLPPIAHSRLDAIKELHDERCTGIDGAVCSDVPCILHVTSPKEPNFSSMECPFDSPSKALPNETLLKNQEFQKNNAKSLNNFPSPTVHSNSRDTITTIGVVEENRYAMVNLEMECPHVGSTNGKCNTDDHLYPP